MLKIESHFGLVGYPIEHSKSPALHNESFKLLNIEEQYSLFPILPENFHLDFPLLLSSPIIGLNITMPYKQTVLPYLDFIDPISQLTQSVNTIYQKDQHYYGTSTDGVGFFRSLFYKSPNIALDSITLLGCGGAARSILATGVINQLPIKNIHIFQRGGPHFNEARDFIYNLNHSYRNNLCIHLHQWDDLNLLKEALAQSTLCINCTPIGLLDDNSPISDMNILHSNLHVYDIIYKKNDTTLIKQAKARHCSYQCGIGMLLFQGAESFYHFTGVQMPIQKLTCICLDEI